MYHHAFTEARKLEIVRLLWHKLKRKELGPEAAIWINGSSLYLRTTPLDDICYISWEHAERLAHSDAGLRSAKEPLKRYHFQNSH